VVDPTIGPTTVGVALDAVLDAYDALTGLAEGVEDEWQYVQDLTAAWRARLTAVSAERGSEPLAAAADRALARLADEAALIPDPHQAIDWLSTYPQVALAALGERP
jgi:hypothetical protein